MKFPAGSLIALAFILSTSGCTGETKQAGTNIELAARSVMPGKTIGERFDCPKGYQRVAVEKNSFGSFMRSLPLLPNGSPVHYYNGELKPANVHAAVINMDVGPANLQQCADAIIRLRAEYLFGEGRFREISFRLTNGFPVGYDKWRAGFRVAVNGNNCNWVKTQPPDSSYKSFRKYLDFIFTYAGTLSLSRELQAKKLQDITVGDIFIRGGSPGHAVIVVDVAENEKGEKLFMLAQSYMPAQQIHILKNKSNPASSPWYSNQFAAELYTPEWTFQAGDLKGWP